MIRKINWKEFQELSTKLKKDGVTQCYIGKVLCRVGYSKGVINYISSDQCFYDMHKLDNVDGITISSKGVVRLYGSCWHGTRLLNIQFLRAVPVNPLIYFPTPDEEIIL